MGERKVQNRYFPPDFDPALVPKRRWDPYKQTEVRMMIPFNMQCNRCGEFMYRGTKFNSRKEDAIGEEYLGVRVYRFYIKCSQCSNEIAFKTDPKNMDYVCESGATRNFENWRQMNEAESTLEKERKQEEQGDAMAALEARTLDSKIEMDILDALDEIKASNERHAHLQRDPAALLQHRQRQAQVALSAQDQADVDAFNDLQRGSGGPVVPRDPRRPPDDDDDDDDERVGTLPSGDAAASAPPGKKNRASPPPSSTAALPGLKLVTKRRRIDAEPASAPASAPPAPAPAAPALSLVGYGSSSGSGEEDDD